ncbi:hypothetical protein GCM10007094_41600 [Pseudovibrio japonicus]|uniref:Cytochrome c domain-containing protein n=1 Tax=Pseudovibrio japonicus TaxID=366534 RepID=A0ABQ3ES30_9HYPH|nr:cytochrome c [Pseudovibrio japonicus]GHB47959.1 hypothetical protein GCM10007094_41600 [Pseudovibrio japonicus]
MNSGKKVLLLVGLLAIVAVASAVYFYANDRQEVRMLRPYDQALIAQGADVYAQNCAPCHGANLEGEPDWKTAKSDGSLPAPPHDETGHTWHHDDDLLFRITKFGTAKAAGLDDLNSNMPAFEDTLSDQEIIAVLSWIKAQWPEEMQKRHDEMNERTRSLRK